MPVGEILKRVEGKGSRPPATGAISREVVEGWVKRGREAAAEYNGILTKGRKEGRKPTYEENRRLDELKKTVQDANKAFRIYETQPKGPNPRAPRGFKEEAKLIDVATGSIVAHASGERHMVKMHIPKNGLYRMTHSHSTDTPHSIRDIHVLIGNDHLKEMQVATPNKTYTLTKTEKTPPAVLARRIYGQSTSALTRGINAKHRSSTAFTSQEELVKKIADELHLGYSVQDR